MKKLIAEKSCGHDAAVISTIGQFCIFAEEFLHLQDQDYCVILTGDKEKHGIKTTAFFNPSNNQVVIYTDGRHQHDICRSIAHEMVHMQQGKHDFYGRRSIKDVGGYFEDQANAVAGQIVKLFIYK
jgi:hypothetical protein